MPTLKRFLDQGRIRRYILFDRFHRLLHVFRHFFFLIFCDFPAQSARSSPLFSTLLDFLNFSFRTIVAAALLA